MALAAAVAVLPLLSYQLFHYNLFCKASPFLATVLSKPSLAIPPPSPSPWCQKVYPDVYSYVQGKYWDVGLFKYYRISQIPNFLLAAPVLCISTFAVFSYSVYLYRYLTGRSIVVPGTIEGEQGVRDEGNPSTKSGRRAKERGVSSKRINVWYLSALAPPASPVSAFGLMGGFYSPSLCPFVLHMAAMTAIAVLVMHIQVVTRFLSASPALYWYAASVVEREDTSVWTKRAIVLYFLTYALVGCILFSNFYPWT